MDNANGMKPRKPETEKAVVVSLSLPKFLKICADERSRAQGYPSRSDYLQDLIRNDAQAEIIKRSQLVLAF